MKTGVGITLLLVVALALGPVGAAATPSTPADAVVQGTSDGVHGGDRLASTGENTLTRTTTFALRPGDPGRIRVEIAFTIPDQVVRLKTAVPENASVIGRDGFRSTGDGNYSWDERTTRPSITLSLQVNRTGTYHQRPNAAGDRGLMFADVGDWAIAPVPSAAVWWSSLRSEPPVSFARETAVDGAGVAGDQMVYLGDHESRTRTIDGQEISLVVPDAARLEPSADAIFETFTTASTALPASPVAESLVIAAPTDVEWGPYGLADGSDTWVRADQPLDTAGNVWVHEFVHLRQDFRTTAETRWIREGMPEYYAALFTFEAGHIGFDEFAAHLDRGTRSRYADTVLADPDSWTGLANYAKGALVYGALDRSIRSASDRRASALQVFAAMNDHEGPVDQAFLVEQIAAVSDAETVAAFDWFTTGSTPPSMWSTDAHESAFGTVPPKFTTAVTDDIQVTGPYRNLSVSTIPTLVTGERLTFPVTVSNEGDASGTNSVQLEANGRTVDSVNGTLAGGATTSVNLSYPVVDAGSVELEVGPQRWTVTVAEPAAPAVTALSARRTAVPVGETVRVTAQFENPATVPATGTVVLSVDGATIERWSITLDAGDTTTRSTDVMVSTPGERRIDVGTQTVIVDGVSPTTNPLPTDTDGETAATTAAKTPGLTGVTASIAFLLLAILLGIRRW